ncbi:uncharacterized protein LOC135839921 isoform X2 [Planococcus citri]
MIPSEAPFGNWKKKKMKIKEQGLKPEGEIDFNVEYYDSYVEFPVQKRPNTKPRDQWENFEPAEFSGSTETKEQYVMFKEARKAALTRQSTNLKVEGDFEDSTETREKYLQPETNEKATLARRNTTLKLEGEIDLSTETNEKYKEFADVPRTKLLRRYSNLEIPREAIKSATEYRGNFTYPHNAERTPLIRSMENLHTEGEMEFQPEYKTSFIDFHPEYPDVKFRRRSRLQSETAPAKATRCHVKDTIRDGSTPRNPSPEYKHSFVKFPVQRPTFPRPSSNLMPTVGIEEKESELNAKYKPFKINQRTKSLRPSTHLKPEGEIQLSPEYDAAFIDFSHDPSVMKSRQCHTTDGHDGVSFSILDDNADPAKILDRSAERRFQKGKRFLVKNSDESSTETSSKSDCMNQMRPPFRMEVTNPDVVHKPFEKFKSDQSFVVLDENNNHNQWMQNKQKQDRRWSPSWMKS